MNGNGNGWQPKTFERISYMTTQRLSWPELETLRNLSCHPETVDAFYRALFEEIARLGAEMYHDPDPKKAKRGDYSARGRLLNELIRQQMLFMQECLAQVPPEELHS